MAKKTPVKRAFVIDTSVLLYSSKSITSFGDRDVYLPLGVLDELDKFKSSNDENGRNARQVIRFLYDLRHKGLLTKGVEITEKGGKLYTLMEDDTPRAHLSNNVDNRILGTCEKLRESYDEVVLITKDINLAIKSECFGVTAQDYVEDNAIKQLDDLYTGFAVLDVPQGFIDQLYAMKVNMCDFEGVCPNQFLLLRNELNPKHTAFARVSSDFCSVSLIRDIKDSPAFSAWGIKPRNIEQAFALNLLLDDNIPLVSLSGQAGTGKTLCVVAAGLQKVLEEKKYDSLVITRPTVPTGRFNDLGFLPGSIEEKYRPWIQPIQDQVEVLFGSKKSGEQEFEDLMAAGIIKIEPLAYIRGRSFHRNYLILDESQNMSRHEVKTFLTRAGENCKIVMTGDINQIDNPSVDSVSNGLTQVVERFKMESISGHITLTKCERSALAEISAALL